MMSGRHFSGSIRSRVTRHADRLVHVHAHDSELERHECAAAIVVAHRERVHGFQRRLEMHGAFAHP